MGQGFICLLLALLLATLLPGVINRTRALLAGRHGVRFFKHVSNVAVLMRKDSVYSPTTSFVTRIAPVIYLGACLTALLFIPVGNIHPMLSFDGDVVIVAYLLAMTRLALVLAALDTGSSFEGMGASRDAFYGALIEPALLIVAGTMAILSSETSFASIFADTDLTHETVVVPLLLGYVLLNILLVEGGQIPVDDPHTHLELTMIHEVMVLDYSGVDLAFITIGGWIKKALLAILAADAIAVVLHFDPLTVCVLTLAAGVGIGVMESFRARNRLTRNSTFILTIVALAFVVFFVAFLLLKNIL